MCTIVNTKDDAMSLLSAIDDPSRYLSTFIMQIAHRRDVLGKIRELLDEENLAGLFNSGSGGRCLILIFLWY